MNKKALVNILTVVVFFLPMIAMALTSSHVETDLGVAGMAKHLWYAVFLLPLSILPIIIFIRQRKNGIKLVGKLCIIVSVISSIFLVMMLSYSIYYRAADSYNTERVKPIEEKIGIDFPDNIKSAIENGENYDTCYIKIMDASEKQGFEDYILNSADWVSNPSFEVLGILPAQCQMTAKTYDLSMFYYVGTEESNIVPIAKGSYDCIYIGYHFDTSKIVILYNYNVVIK